MPQIIILTGVSAAGKTTLLGDVAEKFPNFYYPKSMTTRPWSKRDENSRKKYIYVSEKEFLEKKIRRLFSRVSKGSS